MLAQALEALFATLDGIALADLMNITQAQMAALQTLTTMPTAARSRKVASR